MTLTEHEAPESSHYRHEPYHAYFSSEISPPPTDGIFRGHFPVQMYGGGEIRLPLRRLTLDSDNPSEDIGIALLMSSQVSHEVMDVLTMRMAYRLQEFAERQGTRIDAVAGIAKLGYGLAARISRHLGLNEWVPFDSGAKLWYTDSLSVPTSSVTSADSSKRLYLDPYNLDRIGGKNIIAIVDDAVNTGGSMAAAVRLAHLAGAGDVVVAPLFTEGHDWERPLIDAGVDIGNHVVSIAHLPVFRPVGDGYTILPGTA